MKAENPVRVMLKAGNPLRVIMKAGNPLRVMLEAENPVRVMLKVGNPLRVMLKVGNPHLAPAQHHESTSTRCKFRARLKSSLTRRSVSRHFPRRASPYLWSQSSTRCKFRDECFVKPLRFYSSGFRRTSVSLVVQVLGFSPRTSPSYPTSTSSTPCQFRDDGFRF